MAQTANSQSKAPTKAVRLADKFDLAQARQLLTGAQAIVRLTLMQRARDEAAGLNTAGYVTGYRGSPIAALEGTFLRFNDLASRNNILFHSGLNEDLAATAIWGAQGAELRGEGKYDGVFAIWYGKGPGVDRSGDAFRHANHAGTSKYGGVLALMGDDHTCESSTSAHQSEFAFVDAMMPVLNPAGVQEILDFGLLGLAMSRYAGVWVGLKCVKDNIESTATVDAGLERVKINIPEDFEMPEGGLNIRLMDTPLAKEARLHEYKRDAVLAFGRANKLDKLIYSGGQAARIGIITTGKSYLDTRQALDELGIDELAAAKLGLRLYKVGMTYPMEPEGFRDFARGLDLLMVIEEKRSLLEVQALEDLYGKANAPVLIGKKDEHDQWLFPAKGALDPVSIAVAIGERLLARGSEGGAPGTTVDTEGETAEQLAADTSAASNAELLEQIKQRLGALKRALGNEPQGPEAASRIPYFCAGCPHNSSTIVPDGSRAYAGIGCHYMAQWMDRNTEGFTQMGAEGANWIGEAPFSKRRHVFQNLGDGTYIHSGSLAIRAAVAADTTITFKLLYNDAVAMTGGQALDGNMSVAQMASQILAEGVSRVVIVSDDPGKFTKDSAIPRQVGVYHRDDLMLVQSELAKEDGVTVLIYEQTCAAEKRRRRKRGIYPDPLKRVFINPAVCEGCGDCGVQSNCIAIAPLETELGRKREIDQSACNKDFSCIKGFCPSFVTVHGASVRKRAGETVAAVPDEAVKELPEPQLPSIDKPYAMLVTGVGGTGVVTISAVLGQAAHLDGKGFGAIDMTGLAQKGGAVACHMRVAEEPGAIHAIRAGVGGADLIIGCDLVVSASNKVLETIKPDKTAVVCNSHEVITGDFTHNPSSRVPGAALRAAIEERVGAGICASIDATDIALRLFGDSIMANMFMLGFAYQKALVPIHVDAIEQAIALNGVAVDLNIEALRVGRLAAHDMAALHKLLKPVAARAINTVKTLEDRITYRADYLTKYQDKALAQRYRDKIKWIGEVERDKAAGRSGLTQAVALSYFKLLAYKDEYEVARLYTDGRFERAVRDEFNGKLRLEFHLAPPLFARKDKLTGLPRKMSFGPWVMPLFRLLARGKALRGTRWDIFGRSAERKRERQMIEDYERLLEEIAMALTPRRHDIAVALARLPQDIKGFGHIKLANHEKAKQREIELLGQLRAPEPAPAAAPVQHAAE